MRLGNRCAAYKRGFLAEPVRRHVRQAQEDDEYGGISWRLICTDTEHNSRVGTEPKLKGCLRVVKDGMQFLCNLGSRL